MATSEQGGINEETSDKESHAMVEEPQDPMSDIADKKKRKRRPPLVPWKKPKDMPRRPLSAYNIFFKEQREAMMAQVAAAEKAAASDASTKEENIETEICKPRTRKRSNKSVGIGFANLARTIAANWKDMDDAARAPYESSAAAEKARYKEEMLVWRAKQEKEKLRILAASRQDGDNQLSSLYPPGMLESSGETSMDDSHTGTVASASSPSLASALAPPHFAMHPSLQVTGTVSRHGPMSVGSMDIDSPKRTRRTYQQHGETRSQEGTMDYDVTPIRLSEMQGRWSCDARSHSYPLSTEDRNRSSLLTHHNHPLHSSLSRLDALQASKNLMDGTGHNLPPFMYDTNMVAIPPFNPNSNDSTIAKVENYNFTQNSNASQAHDSQHEERRFMIQEQQMLQQRHLIHEHQQQQLVWQQNASYFRQDHNARRYSWSGTPGDAQYYNKIPSLEPFNPNMGRMIHSFTPMSSNNTCAPSSIPDSWFEPETSSTTHSTSTAIQNNVSSNQFQRTSRGSKLYPDTWFEVGEEEAPAVLHNCNNNDDCMRYSPDGELNEKLPSCSVNGFHNITTMMAVPTKTGRPPLGKTEELMHPPIRSLECVAGSSNSSSITSPILRLANAHEEVSNKANYSPESFESSSLQALGMQFDEETMDFLAKLRHDGIQGNPGTGNND